MNKFEDITLLHIESSDYKAGVLNPATAQEIDIADIVINGGEIVKNRITNAKPFTETFKGLSLQPADAFKNIAAMTEAGMLISVVDTEDSSDLSDCIFSIVKRYAEAAHETAMENPK